MGVAPRETDAVPGLWLIDLAAASSALEDIERTLPMLEAPSAKVAPAAAERRLSHIALRLLIARTYGTAAVQRIPFTRSAHGKPALPGLAGDFSLSHVAGFALVGLNPAGAIGVDLERPRTLKLSALRLEAIIGAAGALNCVPLPVAEPARTLQAWTRLEALAKADGRGIGFVLEALGVRPRVGHEAGGAKDHAEGLASLAVYDVVAGEGFSVAVALPKGADPPLFRHFPTGMADILDLLG